MVRARIFDIRHGDGTVYAALDRLHDNRVAECLDVSLTLQIGLVIIDGTGNIDGDDQFQIN